MDQKEIKKPLIKIDHAYLEEIVLLNIFFLAAM